MRSTMPCASLTSSAVDLGVAAVSISWNLSVELPQLSTRIFMSPCAAPGKHRGCPHLYSFLYLSFKIVAFASTFASRLRVTGIRHSGRHAQARQYPAHQHNIYCEKR